MNTRVVNINGLKISSEHPVRVQSMCATKTQNVEETVNQIIALHTAGADLIRVAIDSKRDVEALAEIRANLYSQALPVRLVVDLQENYRLVKQVAPFVDKVRYNPGHLHHHERNTPVEEKVATIISTAKEYNLGVRIGVNFGSLDPNEKCDTSEIEAILNDLKLDLPPLGPHLDGAIKAALQSACRHVKIVEDLNFENFVVSLKSSNPHAVVKINRYFRALFPLIPLHLGVTEAGLLPMSEVKSRMAFEPLLRDKIGETIRISLTLPHADKFKEVVIGRKIVEDVKNGKFQAASLSGLNIVSCPSCSRVENEAFVKLAEEVREASQYAAKHDLTIAVMGCRVNGPGETDDADIGLWCAPNHVNLKRKGELIGSYKYNEVLTEVKYHLDQLIASS